MPVFTLEQAQQLRDRGEISDDTYQRMYGDAAPHQPSSSAGVQSGTSTETQPAPAGAAPAPPPPPEPEAAPRPPSAPESTFRGPPNPDPDDARKERQRETLKANQQGGSLGEMRYHDKQITDASAAIDEKAAAARKLGIPESKINEALAVDRGHLAQQTAGAVPGQAQATPEQGLVLASDHMDVGPATGAQTSATMGALDTLMRGMTAGLDTQAAGVQLAARTGEAKAKEESAFLDRTAKDDQARTKSNEANEAWRQIELQKRMDDLDKRADDLGRLKVDPNRFWANRDSGDKVLAGIGLFLGSFGSGGNRAVGVITDAINRDIAAQKANIDNQKDAFTAKSGLYKDMLATYKDKRAAEEATRLAYLGNAEIRIKEMAARYSGPEAKAKGLQLLGEIQQKKAEVRLNFMKTIAPMLQAPPGPDTNPETLTDDQRKRFVPGYGLALTEKDAGELKSVVSDTQAAKGSVRELLTLANLPGKSISPEARTKAGQISRMLQAQLRVPILGPGTVNESEREILESIAADPTRIFSIDNNTKTALNTLQQTLDKNLATKLTSFGLKTPTSKVGFKAAAK
jgi:hypothetical protein